MGYKKIIQSGNLIEIYEYEKDINYKSIKKAQDTKFKNALLRKRFHLPRTPRSSVIRPDNARKRKKSFIRLVRSNLIGETAPVLLTLTMYEVRPIRDAWLAFREFNQRLRRNEGKNLRYIAVVEFQKRGAVHYHVLIWGLNEEQTKKEPDLRYYQSLWQRGFVDCLPTDGSPKIAGYLGKYLSKALLDPRLCGQRSYMASQSVLRPMSLPFKTAVEYSEEAFGINLENDIPLREVEYEHKWLGKCHYRAFDNSTKKNDLP